MHLFIHNYSTLYFRNFGLKDLTIGVLGFTLEKSTHVRCSDWQAKQLTNEQVSHCTRLFLSHCTSEMEFYLHFRNSHMFVLSN